MPIFREHKFCISFILSYSASSCLVWEQARKALPCPLCLLGWGGCLDSVQFSFPSPTPAYHNQNPLLDFLLAVVTWEGQAYSSFLRTDIWEENLNSLNYRGGIWGHFSSCLVYCLFIIAESTNDSWKPQTPVSLTLPRWIWYWHKESNIPNVYSFLSAPLRVDMDFQTGPPAW